MMLVQDYPVTTPYGQVPGYPLNDGFHRGIDYGCPTGTPVIVNGMTIGLSGNSGSANGQPIDPHCHVGKWVNGVVQNPGVGNGFTLPDATVFDTGYDDVNGNYVRISSDGVIWVYLHLSVINVSKGQIVQGESMTKQEAYTVTDGFYRWGTGVPPTPEQSESWASQMVSNPAKVQELYEYMKKEAETTAEYIPYSGPELLIKKG